MSIISGDELRKLVEWARNNGKVTHDPSGGVRFEHEGRTYVVPAELLSTRGGTEERVDLNTYAVRT